MSLKDILAKVARGKVEPAKNEVLTTEQVKNKPANSDFADQKGANSETFSELLCSYDALSSWLQTHECRTGTDNKLDLNDRPYDHEQYGRKLKELEEVICEIFSRPVTDGLEEQVRKYGL